MKIIMFFFVCLLSSNIWAIDKEMIEGTWYRTYGVYRPWTDDNQGTFSYYEEDLIFHPNNLVYIYDNNTEKFRGKSVYTLLERDNQDFIVFHTPDQDPTNDLIQQTQGFFVVLTHDKDRHDVLYMMTVKDYTKTRNKAKVKGISYKRTEVINDEPKFIVPRNKI